MDRSDLRRSGSASSGAVGLRGEPKTGEIRKKEMAREREIETGRERERETLSFRSEDGSLVSSTAVAHCQKVEGSGKDFILNSQS